MIPKKMKNYQTIAEIVMSMSETQTLDKLPQFVSWLFGDYKYKFETSELEIYYEFIRQFITRYLNREICYLDPNVWRSELIFKLIAYYPYITKNTELPNLINQLNGLLKETETYNRKLDDLTTDDTTKNKNSTSNTTTNKTQDETTTNKTDYGKENNTTRTDNLTTTNTGNSSASTNNTNVRTGSEATNTANESKTASENNSSTTDDGNTRNVMTDYPQSTVNASTIGNPSLTSWKYASGANDTFNKNTNTSNATSETDTSGTTTGTLQYNNVTDTQNGTSSNETSNTKKDTGTQTTKDTTSGTDTKTTTGKITDAITNENTDNETTTSSENKNKTVDENTIRNKEKDGYTDIDLAIKKYEFWQSHKLTALYDLIGKLEVNFRSLYVDEERMQALTWTDYTNMISEVE